METIKISEQQIMNAVCIYIADKKKVLPTEVTVELMYDDEYGYSAEVEVKERTQILIQANLIEALRMWLDEQDLDPFSARIQLALEETEGIVAFANFERE